MIRKLAFLLFAVPALAQTAPVKIASTTVILPAVTTSAPITATGTAILVYEVTDDGPGAIKDSCPSVPGWVSNIYVPLGTPVPSQGYEGGALFAAFGAKTCTALTVTVTQNGNPQGFNVSAWTGIVGLDQYAGGSGGANSLSITPTVSGELVYACTGGEFAGAVPTVPAPFTMNAATDAGYSPTQQNDIGCAFYVQPTAGPINANWNFGTATNANLIASFFGSANAPPLTIPTQVIPEAGLNAPFTYQLTAAGGVQPYLWALTSGTLPTGVALATTGVLTGSPTAAGATPLTFTVTDSATTPHTATATLTLTVAATPISFAPTTCPAGTQYSAYPGCTLTAAGGTGAITYAYCAPPWGGNGGTTCNGNQAIPEGLGIDPNLGTISGTLHGMGQYTVEFTATDSVGGQATQLITFEIAGSSANGICSFPADSIWYANVSKLPVDASPLAPIYSAYQGAKISAGFGDVTYGIPYITVPATQPLVPVIGSPYFTTAPIPFDAPMEGTRNSVANPPDSAYTGDDHVLVEQVQTNGTCKLYEIYYGFPNIPDLGTHTWGNGTNDANSFGQVGVTNSAFWDMSGYALLPAGGTNAAAGGLPIAPLLEDASEVIGTGTPSAPNGVVREPKRFTVQHTAEAHVWPAQGQAGQTTGCTGGYVDSTGNNLFSQLQPPTACTGVTGPMGEIYRLKAATVTPACAATAPQSAIIIQGFRDHGIILDDNGESGAVIGTNDSRWNNADLACLNSLHLSDFEPVSVQALAVNWPTSSQISLTGGGGTGGGGTTPPAGGISGGSITIPCTSVTFNSAGAPICNQAVQSTQ